MKREYHKWYSERLGRDMELLVFGHDGLPAIVFPTSQGRFFLGQGLQIVAVGLVLGLGAAFALTRFLSSSLYEVRAWDPTTFAVVPLLFLIAALVASLVPAQRAANSDPMIILRRE